MLAVAIELPELEVTNGLIFPTPELDKPILELLFTQFKLAPFEGKLKLINEVVCPLQYVWFVGEVKFKFGAIAIKNDLGKCKSCFVKWEIKIELKLD